MVQGAARLPDRIKSFKRALKDANVGIASLLPMYRWASNDEFERQAGVRHWKRAIEIAVELGVDTMNSEFGRGPHPDKGSCDCCHTGSMIEACEDAWWRSMEELVPVFEKEGIQPNVEPHPEDWCETLQPALDIIRTVNSPKVKFLYCAPHTYYFGDDTVAMLREAADVLAHVHVGDTFNHKASSRIAQAIDAKTRGDDAFLAGHHYPGIESGTEGVRWLEACVRSADAGATWVPLDAPVNAAEQGVNAERVI